MANNMTTLQILQGVHDWVLDKIDEETANFITKTVNDLVNYYTKSETYTKAEVQQIVDAIKQFTYEVVQVLPTASASTMNKIYLVPAPKSEDKNVKEEYITIQNGSTYSWEMLGTTSIDLSNYYTKGQTDSAISSALSSALASYTTTADLTTLLAQKQDVIQDLAAIRSGASAGATAVQPSTLNSALSDTVAESGVYDVTANNNNAKFASLSALLGSENLDTLIPSAKRKGGMSIKFVQSSDNKYVQARCMAQNFTTNVSDWQGVDDRPTYRSKNLVESSGVLESQSEYLNTIFKKPVIKDGYVIYKDGTRHTLSGYYVTDYLKIKEGCDLIVLGFTAKTSTHGSCLSLYSSNTQDSWIQSETEKDYVYISADELKSLGAEYFRCTFSPQQISTGIWFVINDNIINEIYGMPISVHALNAVYTQNSVTIDALYVFTKNGLSTFYANGTSSSHQPVTFTFSGTNLILVLRKGAFEMLSAARNIDKEDVVLLAFNISYIAYGGLLYNDYISYIGNTKLGEVEGSLNSIIKSLTESFASKDIILISGGGVKKADGGDNSGTAYRTDYLPIKQNAPLFVHGITTNSSTALALYNENGEHIYSEQNDSYVYVSAEDLLAKGAKTFRCSISAEQVDSGNWGIFHDEHILDSFVGVTQRAILFTDTEKEIARSNIGAASSESLLISNNIDLSDYIEQSWAITADNKWSTNVGSNRSIFVNIVPGKTYRVSTQINAPVAVLKNITRVNNGTPNFSENYSERILVRANVSFIFTNPSDGRYLYMLIKGSQGNTGITLEEVSYIKDIVTSIVGSGIDSYNNVASKRRIANAVGNKLTPLSSVPVNDNNWEIPQFKEVLYVQKKAQQMVRLRWTPLHDVPATNNEPFPANVEVTGLPYSSVKENDKYVGFDVSILTFMTAINNPYSLIYTENVLGVSSRSAWGKEYHGLNCGPYYGVVCSAFSGYCTGQIVQWPTHADKWCAEKNLNMVKIYDQSAQGLQIGDIYWRDGHNMLVSGLKRDAENNVTHVLISESTPPKTIQNQSMTASAFNNNLANYNAIMYRNIELYKNTYTPSDFVAADGETISPYSYNDDICTFAGDRATFRENDLIVLNYNLKSNGGWTGIKVYKDDVLESTYNLSNIDQSLLPEGQKDHALNLGSSHNYGKYKACMTDGTNDSDYTYWEVLEAVATFSKNEDGTYHIAWSSRNGAAISFTVCNQAGVVYAHNELSIEEIETGSTDIDLINLNKEQRPTSPFADVIFLKIHFQGEYGRSTNEPLLIQL